MALAKKKIKNKIKNKKVHQTECRPCAMVLAKKKIKKIKKSTERNVGHAPMVLAEGLGRRRRQYARQQRRMLLCERKQMQNQAAVSGQEMLLSVKEMLLPAKARTHLLWRLFLINLSLSLSLFLSLHAVSKGLAPASMDTYRMCSLSTECVLLEMRVW